jgi:hypothetical protein
MLKTVSLLRILYRKPFPGAEFSRRAMQSVHFLQSSILHCSIPRTLPNAPNHFPERVLCLLCSLPSASPSVRCHTLRLLFALKADDSCAAARPSANLDEPRSQPEPCAAIALALQALRVKPNDKDLEFMNRGLISGSPIVCLGAARRATLTFSHLS